MHKNLSKIWVNIQVNIDGMEVEYRLISYVNFKGKICLKIASVN
jgi:hypothetical protein